MASVIECYTYRAGKRVDLVKRLDSYVVRALPHQMTAQEIIQCEQISSASTRLTCRMEELEDAMIQSRTLAPTHHSYLRAETGEEFLITDRIIVTFKPGIPEEQRDVFAGRYGLVKKQSFTSHDVLYQVTDHTGMNPVKLIVTLNEDQELLEGAEHDLNQRPKMREAKLDWLNDPFYARQWHLHERFRNTEFDVRASSRCEEAWKVLGHFGQPDVVIGLTDDGCRLDHPDLDAIGKFAGWGYMVGERLVKHTDVEASRASMYQAGLTHGTSSAGVIAGEMEGFLTVGAAPGCRLFPIKWQGNGTHLFISDSKMLNILQYIGDKVDVLSNSWGSAPTGQWIPLVVKTIKELVQTGGRRGKGLLFVWAAGNENCPINFTASQDVPVSSGWRVIGNRPIWVGVETARRFSNDLVGIPGVLQVAALASSAKRSHFSNYGPGIDLCAPTNNAHKYHRLSVKGLGVPTSTHEVDRINSDFGGASSAAPLVAGIAALAISAYPDLTAVEVASLLKRTASKDLNFEGYERTPPASYDLDPTWDISPIPPFDDGSFQEIGDADGTWSPWFGHGKVDALAVVREALQRTNVAGSSRKIFQAQPNLLIPDANETGLMHTIQVAQPGMIQDLRIGLDVTHTWVGDLRIRLLAPDGTIVWLHDRNGAGQNQIQRTWDGRLIPELGAMRGKPIAGDWTIHIQDLAAQDVGTLNSWVLDVAMMAGVIKADDTQSALIPDNNPQGVSRSLIFQQSSIIMNLSVEVDITHCWVGDLRVTLTAPDGTLLRLDNSEEIGADHLVKTWRTQDHPDLQVLRGTNAQGEWKLHIVDPVHQAVGKLNRWSVEVFE